MQVNKAACVRSVSHKIDDTRIEIIRQNAPWNETGYTQVSGLF
jgi:hypothetical protein